MRLSPLFSYAAVVAFGVVVEPSVGAAFCRTTTVENPGNDCPEPCVEEGLPLYWPKRELVYTLNKAAFPDLTGDDLHALLRRVFGVWQHASCDGEPIDLTIIENPNTTDLTAGPQSDEPNENVIAYIEPNDWEGDKRAFAITKIWYNGRNGHILGADMLFNGNMDPFGICPDEGCARDELTDLANVMTHEIGHFLGLAHSTVPRTTMWCDAAPGDTDKRSLEPDDIAGLCSMYGPHGQGVALPKVLAMRGENGCNVGAGRRGTPLAAIGLLAVGLALWAQVRRRV